MNPAVLRQQMGHSSATMTAPAKFPSIRAGRFFPRGNWKIWKMAALYVQSLSRV
jgi:hypothetical protein